jgi:tetratricopeptide (TPR) repeat protein
LQEYDLALQYHPFSPFLLFSKAMIHADLDQFDQALDLLYQAVKLEPNFIGGHQMLGKMLTHLGRETEAEIAIQQAEELRRKYAAREPESQYVYSLLRPLE